jgi:hypothetical protein
MRKVLFLSALFIATSSFGQDLTTSLQTILKAYLHTKQIKPTLGNVLQLSNGTVAAVYGFSNKKTGTADSDRGEITNGTLLIYYDIGFSAGTHMSDLNKQLFDWYVDNTNENWRTMLGIKKGKDSSEIVITIYGGDNVFAQRKEPSPVLYPANFWAYVKTEADIKNLLEIAWSYTPKQK